jgi:hypothetical protein
MIRHDLKCIFIHVNKTGGSSIVSALNMLQVHMSASMLFGAGVNHDGQAKLWNGWKGGQRITTQNWSKLDEIKNYWDEYLTFTIVRNPWDRVVSDFFYCKKHSLVGKDVTFREDVLSTIDSRERWKRPCYDWISLNDKIVVDNIIRFEKLNEGFDDLCERLGVPDIKLPHLNKTKHAHYTDYYDNETRRLVAEKYAKDIEHFGYRFG